MRIVESVRARFAVAIIAFGVLVMSSGLALIAAAAPANAAAVVPVCHATSADVDPYELVEVEEGTPEYDEHVAHRATPTEAWQAAGYYDGVWHGAGDPKPDLVGGLDEGVTAETCGYQVVAPMASDVTVTPTQPTCANDNTASYAVDPMSQVADVAESAAPSPGATIEITVTAEPPYAFFVDNAWSPERVFPLTFDEAEECDADPIIVTPTAPDFINPTCDLDGDVEFPDIEGVDYEVDGGFGPGDALTVIATPADGYAFDGDSQEVSWPITFPNLEDCDLSLAIPSIPDFIDPSCFADGSLLLDALADLIGDIDTSNFDLGDLIENGDLVFGDGSDDLLASLDYEGVHYEAHGSFLPGETLEVIATALDGFEIPEGFDTDWTHLFTIPEGCEVDPPVDSEGAGYQFDFGTSRVVTPTVVHAGLGDAVDMRGRQGIALFGAGLALVITGGAVRVWPRRRRAD